MSMVPPQIHSIRGLRTQESLWKFSAPEMKVAVVAKESGVLTAVSPNMMIVVRLKTEPNSLETPSLNTRTRLGTERQRPSRKTKGNVFKFYIIA